MRCLSPVAHRSWTLIGKNRWYRVKDGANQSAADRRFRSARRKRKAWVLLILALYVLVRACQPWLVSYHEEVISLRDMGGMLLAIALSLLLLGVTVKCEFFP